MATGPAESGYELHYFDGVGGRAELTRLLFKFGKIPFREHAIPFDSWPQVKHNYPNSQVPVLKFDGNVLPQSLAIARFAARKTNLLGDNDWEIALADAFVDTMGDIIAEMKTKNINLKIRNGKGAEVADELAANLQPYLERIEKHLETTNGENLVGDHLTWADVALADVFKRYSITATTVLDSYPRVKKLVETIHNLDGIKDYVAGRSVKFI